MRTLRIRSFTILLFFFVLLVPWIFYVAAHFMETKTLNFEKKGLQDEILQRQMIEIVHQIETNSDNWRDPNWQNQLFNKLQQAKMEAIILSASEQEIFRSKPQSHNALSSTERFSILENGHLLGKVVIYLPKSNAVQIISIFAGLLFAFFIIGVEMRRFLLKPLERMSNSARKIAAGDWEVELPRSRITEISEVRDAFAVMVEGIQSAFQKQAELEEERRFVISAVAHDLRTPLFALRGYLDGLEQGIAQSPDKIAKYLAVCKEKSAQLDRLVEDLFTFTKMENVEMNLQNQTIDFNLIILKSIESLSPQARQKNISILSHTVDDCFINGDMHLLERAMNNILDNAVRHTPSYGEIDIQCYKVSKKLMFTIRDTGPGFSSEELQRVFEPLYRGEVSRNRSTGGSGLGLTISHRIVMRHGGELSASNHSEGGALLTGWIPLAAPSFVSRTS
ncbi:sensor histidine kinase [Paenibacillus sp. TAB 01]|uniref:sensor histidine kinase n=1 Tax=Paenibacillus sp. TAB 01 TaxID=3368988 RepID=UPI0037530BF1